MIYAEKVMINGKQYDHTYSDKYFIERDGVQYVEAIDPLNSERKYTETDVLLPPKVEELTPENALEIITGEMQG